MDHVFHLRPTYLRLLTATHKLSHYVINIVIVMYFAQQGTHSAISTITTHTEEHSKALIDSLRTRQSQDEPGKPHKHASDTKNTRTKKGKIQTRKTIK